jgi:hypothetical protein
MKPYTTEVEFLRDEVEKCHASMHSQIETISLLMKKNIALKEQNREWVGLTDEEIKEIIGPWGDTPIKGYTRKLFDQIETKLREKNGG